jgi:hypothetical protein
MKRALKVMGGAVSAAAGIYGGYVATTYVRFGRVSGKPQTNSLLNQFMPEHEIGERHSVSVSSPAATTFAAAREIAFHDSRIVRTIFGLRALPGRFLGVPPARPSAAPSSMR